jgi:hypothetical protein
VNVLSEAAKMTAIGIVVRRDGSHWYVTYKDVMTREPVTFAGEVIHPHEVLQECGYTLNRRNMRWEKPVPVVHSQEGNGAVEAVRQAREMQRQAQRIAYQPPAFLDRTSSPPVTEPKDQESLPEKPHQRRILL